MEPVKFSTATESVLLLQMGKQGGPSPPSLGALCTGRVRSEHVASWAAGAQGPRTRVCAGFF